MDRGNEFRINGQKPYTEIGGKLAARVQGKHIIHHLFRWSSFWCWRVCKQAKLSHFAHRKPDAPKTGHCCGFWSRGIIGPFFFENEQAEEVTVNGDRYRAMLNEFLFTKIKEVDIGNIWFQQGGAMCHTAEAAVDVLRPVLWAAEVMSLATSELWFDTVGLLFVRSRQR